VPAYLAGKKARCPQCKTPMTIPVPHGSQLAINPLVSTPLDDNPLAADPLAMDALEPHALDNLVVTEAARSDDLPVLEVESIADAGEAPWHPTADLVARLWAEREHGGTVEVHHDDGVIMPEWYDVAWSRGTHGVFGSQAPDGTVTITAVAWSAVQKVIVRQVQTLPADMFPAG
jgi:hypothetical protein